MVNQDGGDIIVYGGASFVSSLVQLGLIDEYNLFINPAVIGSGMSIFDGLEDITKMKLLKAKSFDCGIVLLSYEPIKAEP